MCLEIKKSWYLNEEKLWTDSTKCKEPFLENEFMGKEWVLMEKVRFWGAHSFFLWGKY